MNKKITGGTLSLVYVRVTWKRVISITEYQKCHQKLAPKTPTKNPFHPRIKILESVLAIRDHLTLLVISISFQGRLNSNTYLKEYSKHKVVKCTTLLVIKYFEAYPRVYLFHFIYFSLHLSLKNSFNITYLGSNVNEHIERRNV